MLTSLAMTRFRAFPSLTLEGLTRVNLLVGENNAGKTCVLEGSELLLSGGSPLAIYRIASRRGETRLSVEGRREVDVSHLFHGHPQTAGASFILEGQGVDPARVRCELLPGSGDSEGDAAEELPFRSEQGQEENPLVLRVTGRRTTTIPLGPSRFPSSERFRRPGRPEDEQTRPVLMIGARAGEETSLGTLWDRIVLTPEEPRVVEALRLIEPSIERVASLASSSRYESSSIHVRLTGSEQRLPLGSMGDGVKRLFVLAIHLVNASGGFLLVDEIDTGLHHSVMVKMWRLVLETARRLDIQVFASTHSLDCLQALAEVYEHSPELHDELSLHRIERGLERSVRFTADEVLVAARRSLEIR